MGVGSRKFTRVGNFILRGVGEGKCAQCVEESS